MKKILKALLYCGIAITIITACKKNEFSEIVGGTVEAKEYIFNRATNTFESGNEVTSNISATNGVKVVYSYLVRAGKPNLLVQAIDNSKSSSNDFMLNIPVDTLRKHDLTMVSGLKIMVKQRDNSTLEGFISIKYFDPALPQFSNFPTTITANLEGGTTAITGTVKSEFGIKQVDIYDDSQTENTYVLVNSITGIANVKEYALNYAYTYRKAAQHIKIKATDIYNQSQELIINMPVDVNIFKPKLENFATSITPNTSGTTPVSGRITSVTGLKKVDIYDDRNGAYQLLGTEDNLNGVKTYSYSAAYTFKKRAANIKIIATDTEDVQAEVLIPLNFTYQSTLYRDVEMNAQTLGTKTGFLLNGLTIGNCELNASEASLYLIFGAQSTGPVLFNPATAATGSIASNLRCNNVGWTATNTSLIHDTKFRVLIDGASTGQSNIYDLLEANEIDDLSNTFFSTNSISNPSSNNPRFDTSVAATTSIFNKTTARVIFIKITDPTTGVIKNAIINVKDCAVGNPVGNSTIKFDIYIQK